MIQLGKMRVDKVPMLVMLVSDYDILMRIDDLIRLGALINCQNNNIYFSKYKDRVTCDGKSRESRSAMMKPQELPDSLAMFPKVFVKEVPQELPPPYKIMHRISLIYPMKLLKTPNFKPPQALMTKYNAWINKKMNAGIHHSVPKRPVRTMGRHSGRSGYGFEKPGEVQFKSSTAAQACRRWGNRWVERIGDRQMPRQSLLMPRYSRQMAR